MGAAQHRLQRTAAPPLARRRVFQKWRENRKGVSPVPPLSLSHSVIRDKMKGKV
jgi:hypothetical protein